MFSFPTGGCAAFGHACYGGHGKRSSSSSSLSENQQYPGGSASQLGGIPPLPYAKLALINRSKAFDDASPSELRLVNPDSDNTDQMEDYGARQDKFERAVQYAVNAVLRQLVSNIHAGIPLGIEPFMEHYLINLFFC